MIIQRSHRMFKPINLVAFIFCSLSLLTSHAEELHTTNSNPSIILAADEDRYSFGMELHNNTDQAITIQLTNNKKTIIEPESRSGFAFTTDGLEKSEWAVLDIFAEDIDCTPVNFKFPYMLPKTQLKSIAWSGSHESVQFMASLEADGVCRIKIL